MLAASWDGSGTAAICEFSAFTVRQQPLYCIPWDSYVGSSFLKRREKQHLATVTLSNYLHLLH